MAEEPAEASDINLALVEYVRGIKSRKWSLQLGQTYVVGKAGGCVDIEIDHASISRKHFSLAVAKDESDELLLVGMDHSSHGTFLNKKPLVKDEGLKVRVADVRFLVFGKCENGYKFFLRGDTDASKEKAPSADSKETAKEGSNVESKKDQQVDAWSRGGTSSNSSTSSREGRSRSPPGDRKDSGKGGGMSRRERRAAENKSNEYRKDKSKTSWRSATADGIADKVTQKRIAKGEKDVGEELKIDWPEEWK
eukprot:TRINITY_DN7906_c0_g1_i1.p1 TRINITY_DN7906_c0_g1~~TRINITY_DN7906_c0_g1_i1.p1  ORF type:complete len:286 (-),score=53.26 TRINITY_DN7906_c0_g1_i1:37-789(-)